MNDRKDAISQHAQRIKRRASANAKSRIDPNAPDMSVKEHNRKIDVVISRHQADKQMNRQDKSDLIDRLARRKIIFTCC